MRFDPNKSYTYPVLRPSSLDYPKSEFEVEIQAKRLRGTTALTVTAIFVLSDSDLQALVSQGKASYVLRIKAPAAHHRSAYISPESQIHESFDDGQLHGRLEIWGFLVARQRIEGFRSEGWHDDYGRTSFNLEAGAVLAQDEPKEYWVDMAEEAMIGSIFELRVSDGLAEGSWEVDLDGDRVSLHMSAGDYQRFCEARDRVNNTEDAAYVMNSVYLPALIWTLQMGDSDPESFRDRRWFRSLEARLSDCECQVFGSEAVNRLLDAQKLLERPFADLPLMAHSP